jgi:hypothetical protein
MDTPLALIHVEFVTEQLCRLGSKHSASEGDQARRCLCSGSARKKDGRWNETELEVLKLGSVRGTFGIQLSAYLLLTHPENGNHATIEKGKSGYYKCVNLHLQNKYNEKNLSTE